MKNYKLVTIFVNERPVTAPVEPHESLLDFLRHKAGAVEVKCGCNQGDCGTCTVLFKGKAVKSCLVLALQANEKDVRTIKGFTGDFLMEKLQESFVRNGAVQCGFCTPGMLISSYAFLQANPQPTREEIKTAISGNLCRCTGYKKIIDAVEEAAFGEASTKKATSSGSPEISEGQEEVKGTYLLLGGG
jgi:carbon-monoxide dehydrogenase small subunit